MAQWVIPAIPPVPSICSKICKMSVKELRDLFFITLKEEYPEEEIGSFFYELLREYLDLRHIDLALQPDLHIEGKDLDRFRQALKRLEVHEPLQYITGKTEFFGLPFFVNPDVLIPRPETEELVAWILEDVSLSSARSTEPLKILDIGTGSGCIAISLAEKLPDAEVFALDLSEKALAVAKKNAEANSVSVNFIQTDILKAESLPGSFDIIVSNPPYVRELEKSRMHSNVVDNEPHLALFVEDEDPLLFYRKIALLAKDNFKTGGLVYFEINEYLGEETANLLKSSGFSEVILRQDIFGKDRMLKGIRHE